MDRDQFFDILSKVKTKQKLGQHMQVFMDDVIDELNTLVEGEIPEKLVVRAVLRGLTPSILVAMPLQDGPWTQELLLRYGDNLQEYLPLNDPHWDAAPLEDRPKINFPITIQNEDYVPIFCFKCGESGHKADKCTGQRLNYLRPRDSQRRNKRKNRQNRKNRNMSKNKNSKNKK